jgi:CRP/FNR family transcriptional regulator, anaerobic regulatory protein
MFLKNSTLLSMDKNLSFENFGLLKFIETIYPVSNELREDLIKSISVEQHPKKTLLLKGGEVFKKMYFIEKGLARAYYFDEGKEITSWFMKEGDFVISVHSFYKQSPSRENIALLEDAVLASITYTQLQELYKKHLEFNFISRVLTEHYYSLSEERIFAMRQSTVQQRFDFFSKSYPEILLRVPLKQIAAFLRTTPETLSRLRAQRIS